MDSLQINVEEIPYKQLVVIADEEFNIQFRYNEMSDTMEVDLLDTQDQIIHAGETMIYDTPLWYAFQGQEKYPKRLIVPTSIDGLERPVNLVTLGSSVVLVVI